MGVLTWPFLPTHRQQFFLALMSGELGWQQITLRNPLNLHELEKNTPILREVSQLLSKAGMPETFKDSLHGVRASGCGLVKTHEMVKSKSPALYRWKDERGVWHFGDKTSSVPNQAVDISSSYQSKVSYFNLSLRGDSQKIPAFSKDRIRAETTQIFTLISEYLPVASIRQIDLNIRLIASQNDFQKHRESYAPELQTNSGFYTTVENEAVVWQGLEPDILNAVIRHESTHVIMAGLYGFPPVWLNEGMAEYFEQLLISANSKKIAVNSYWQALLQKKSSVDYEAYFSLAPDEWRNSDQKTMYAMAWGAVNFLMSNSQNKTFFSKLLRHLSANKCEYFSTLNFISKHYSGGISGFNNNFKYWLFNDVSPHYY